MGARLAFIIDLYAFVFLARAVFSWLPFEHRQNRLYDFIYAVTEPVLRPVRKALPPMSGFDFSPVLVLLFLFLIAGILR